jgi:hypothetical protein
MQVYHGSDIEIFDIDLSKSQSNKDFGKGFYVTKFRKHAESWAVNISRRYDKKPFVTEFTFYERAFEESRYNVLRFDDYNEAWLDFVVLNRDPAFTTSQHDYDLIEGPIADDKVQNRINDFLDGLITKNDFLNELKYHEETHQVCFCTINSLQLLKKTDIRYSSYVVRISECVIENLMIDLSIDEKQSADIFYTSKTFVALSEKSTELYKKSWQEIYSMLETELRNDNTTKK